MIGLGTDLAQTWNILENALNVLDSDLGGLGTKLGQTSEDLHVG